MNKVSGVERQLYILALLSENKKGYTLQEIIDAMERAGIDATMRMVSRDIDYISQNFFVYEEIINKKNYYKADKYGLGNIDFSMAQIISLYFAKEVLHSYSHLDIGKSGEKIIDNILEKLSILSKNTLDNISQMLKVVPTHSPLEEVDYEIFDTVKKCMEDKKIVIIEYLSFSKDEKKKREFAPYVIEVNDGCYHVIGKCYLRNAIRDFRVSRILSAISSDKSFEIPKKFYDEYNKNRFDKLAGDELFDVKIEFRGTAKKLLMEFDYYKGDKIEDNGQTAIFYKRTALSKDLTSWLLSFGSQIKVLEPLNFKENIKTEIDNMVNIYKD